MKALIGSVTHNLEGAVAKKKTASPKAKKKSGGPVKDLAPKRVRDSDASMIKGGPSGQPWFKKS